MRLYLSGVCKKPSLKESEDMVGENAGFYWLLDGATPPVGEKSHEATYTFVQSLHKALTTVAKTAESPERLLYDSIEFLKVKSCENNSDGYLPCSTAVIVQVFGNCLHYLVLGDSFLCICTEKDNLVITDNRLKSVAVEERKIVRELRESGISEKSNEYLTARKNLIFTELESRNKDGGYWITELNPNAALNAQKGTIQFEQDEHIFIFAATDGLERLVSVFGAYNNLKEIGDAIVKEGDRKVSNLLRELENNPTAFKKPVSSKHDDASYFLLTD